jgi:hypothetical protein
MKRSPLGLSALAVALVALAILVRGFDPMRLLPTISQEKLRQSIMTAIQRESPEQFYVTGVLDLNTTTISKSEKVLLPSILAIDMGTTVSSVSMPGRASYGFDVNALRAEDIDLIGDSVIEITLPPLTVHAVEPDLSKMRSVTEAGWARMESRSGKRMERRSLEAAIPAMREQAKAHIATSIQAEANTHLAIEKLLRPVLTATGLGEFRLRVVDRNRDQVATLLSK